MKKFLFLFVLVVFFSLFISNSAVAEPDWSSIPEEEITLFYPGVANWEFLNSPDHSLGARNIKRGKKQCKTCHVSDSGEYDIMTEEIAAGRLKMKKSRKLFEPSPIPDKKGFFSSKVQAAYDDEFIYIKVKWKSKGTSWYSSENGSPDRVSLQINKDQKLFKKYGCMLSCHSSADSMPESISHSEVRKHPYYSKKNRDNIRLYTSYSRTDGGGWADIKSDEELKALTLEGSFIDVWVAEINGNHIKSKDGWILEDRDYDKNDIIASGSFEDGRYSVVFKRKLNTGNPKDVALADGDQFSFALAIHDDKAKQRQHYVSFPFTIGLGTSGEIRAEKL